MTTQEHSRACYTAGHMRYLARIAREAEVITEEEATHMMRCSQKIYSWLQSLPQHVQGEIDDEPT